MNIEDGNINVRKEEGETSEKTGEETIVDSEETIVDIVDLEETTVDSEETIVDLEETIGNAEETIVSVEESRGEKVERLVNDEYKCWKRQTPFLYDLVISHAIEWPSLTVEWLPDRVVSSDGSCSVQKLILGTHATDGEPNYLIIAQVKLPILDDSDYDEYGNLDDYKDDRSQLESGAGCKIQLIQQIHHDGEVARARHMPQDPCIIATKTTNSEVHIFNYKNHPAKPSLGGTSNPDLRLTGHTSDGFGLSWSTINQGLLLSSSDDSKICLWDVNQNPVDKAIDALQSSKAHKGPVEDVAWHKKHRYLFASCGSDRYLHIYDCRSPCLTTPIQRLMAHQSAINCLSFNPVNEFLVATGSTDMTVKSFDLRNLTRPLHTFNRHKDGVAQIGWSPFNPSILASSCAGRRLMVWDTGRIGQQQSSKDAEDGPPELLFIHGGHTDRIPDFSWNPTEDWVIASVADDNMLQVWQMCEGIYSD